MQEEALGLAKKIASRGPKAVAMAKKSIRRGFNVDLNEGLKIEAEYFAQTLQPKIIMKESKLSSKSVHLNSPENNLAYKPQNHIRIITAASLFDGHDAAINIMRRILQDGGAEVIHLGHNKSVQDVVKAALPGRGAGDSIQFLSRWAHGVLQVRP